MKKHKSVKILFIIYILSIVILNIIINSHGHLENQLTKKMLLTITK
jgi:predicted carbohydrate-binding protein with CBM5 and CBM33 domain